MDAARRYTLAELADASAAALDALEVAARNGQVRDRPDVRMLRYYSTLGLVDRPAEMAGRTALYGDRHLLQVVAVKALQARGASLADVQRSLVGSSEDELRRAIGPGLPAALAATEAPPTGHGGRAFWRTPPEFPAPKASVTGEPDCARGPATGAPAAGEAAAGDEMRARRMTAVPLGPGATLLIDGDRALDADAIRAAAAPLLTYLSGAGLLPGTADPARS